MNINDLENRQKKIGELGNKLDNTQDVNKIIDLAEQCIENTTFLINENYNIEKNKELRAKASHDLSFYTTDINKKIECLDQCIEDTTFLIGKNYNIERNKDKRAKASHALSFYTTDINKKIECLDQCIDDTTFLIDENYNIEEKKELRAYASFNLSNTTPDINKKIKGLEQAIEDTTFLIDKNYNIKEKKEIRAYASYDLSTYTQDINKKIKCLEQAIEDTTFLIDENYNIEENKEKRANASYNLSVYTPDINKKIECLEQAIKDTTFLINVNYNIEKNKEKRVHALNNLSTYTPDINKKIECLEQCITDTTFLIDLNYKIEENKGTRAKASHALSFSTTDINKEINLLEDALIDLKDIRIYKNSINIFALLINVCFKLYIVTQNKVYIEELVNILNNIIKEDPLNKQATTIKVNLLIDMSNNKLPNIFQGNIKEEIEKTFKDFLLIFNNEFNETQTLEKKEEFINKYANVIINYLSYLRNKANAEYDNQSDVFKTIWELLESTKSLLEKVLLSTAAFDKSKRIIELNTDNQEANKNKELTTKLEETKTELSNKTRGNTRTVKELEANSKDTLRKIEEIESTIVEINLNNNNYSKELKFDDLKELMLKQKPNTALCYVYSSKHEDSSVKFFRNSGMFIVYKNDKEELEFYIEELKDFESSSLNLYLVLYKLFNVYNQSSKLKNTIISKEEVQEIKEHLLNEINEIEEILKDREDRKTKILKAFEKTFLEDKEFTCIEELFTWANNKNPLEVKINIERLNSKVDKDYDKFLELRIKMTELIIDEVSESILPIINRNIKNVKNIIFSALGNFSQFPLHALKDNNKSFLIKTKNISYIPSLSVLHLRQEKEAIETTDSKLIYQDTEDTASFIAEKEAIENILEDNILEAVGSSNFTSSSFLDYLETSNNNILHLALHGNASESIYSTIELNEDSKIYASDILCSSINSKIVLLSSCETNLDSKGSSSLTSISSFPTVFMIQSSDHILGSFLAIDGGEVSRFTPKLYSKLYSNDFDFSLAFRNSVNEILEDYSKSNNKGFLSKLFKKEQNSLEVDFISSREWFFYAPFSSNY